MGSRGCAGIPAEGKINAYVEFIADGQLSRHYPETAGQPVDIQLDCHESPSGEFAAIIDHATKLLQELGIGFRVNVTGAAR